MLAYSGSHEFEESTSPHSLGLQNAVTVPSPGFDSNPLLILQKQFWGGGLQGCGNCGLSGTDDLMAIGAMLAVAYLLYKVVLKGKLTI